MSEKKRVRPQGGSLGQSASSFAAWLEMALGCQLHLVFWESLWELQQVGQPVEISDLLGVCPHVGHLAQAHGWRGVAWRRLMWGVGDSYWGQSRKREVNSYSMCWLKLAVSLDVAFRGRG